MADMAFEGARIIQAVSPSTNCLRPERRRICCLHRKADEASARTEKALGALWLRHKLEILNNKGIHQVVASENYIGGMLDMGGGHIHPLNLALGEAAAVESLGGIIHEQSPVIRVERGANPVVHTTQGQVKAKFVVVAGNAYMEGLLPELEAKSMPCGTQVVTTEPLS